MFFGGYDEESLSLLTRLKLQGVKTEAYIENEASYFFKVFR